MLLLAPIFFIGVLTTFTDLSRKKIYNQHLAIGAVLGIIVIAYVAVFRHGDVLSHIINGLMAALIGFLLYRSALWRGGDAKLFALYAFLMPLPAYQQLPFPVVIDLFSSSFIAGMLILTPVFIKDIIAHQKAITADLFSLNKREAFFEAFVQMAGYSWVLFPLCYFLRITNPVIILIILYLIFNGNYAFKRTVPRHYIIEYFERASVKILLGLILGILLRLWLAPYSLFYPALIRYIVFVSASAVLSICMRTIFDYFKDYQQRVPFAPLLFIGCMLSYTPFLLKMMQMMARWNALFSR